MGALGANYLERKALAWAQEGVVRVTSPTWPSPGPRAAGPQTPPSPFQEPLCDLSRASPAGQWLPAGVGVAGSKGPSPTGHRPPERGAGTRGAGPQDGNSVRVRCWRQGPREGCEGGEYRRGTKGRARSPLPAVVWVEVRSPLPGPRSPRVSTAWWGQQAQAHQRGPGGLLDA